MLSFNGLCFSPYRAFFLGHAYAREICIDNVLVLWISFYFTLKVTLLESDM